VSTLLPAAPATGCSETLPAEGDLQAVAPRQLRQGRNHPRQLTSKGMLTTTAAAPDAAPIAMSKACGGRGGQER
jgi:hypothetical protein